MQNRDVTTFARRLSGLLIRLRLNRGWSQEKLVMFAQRKGCPLSRSTVQRMEKGEVGSMSLENICFYCNALGIPPERILPIDFDIGTEIYEHS